MKIYATIESERDSRPVKKGGDKYLDIFITRGNKPAYNIRIDHDILVFCHDTKRYLQDPTKGET